MEQDGLANHHSIHRERSIKFFFIKDYIKILGVHSKTDATFILYKLERKPRLEVTEDMSRK